MFISVYMIETLVCIENSYDNYKFYSAVETHAPERYLLLMLLAVLSVTNYNYGFHPPAIFITHDSHLNVWWAQQSSQTLLTITKMYLLLHIPDLKISNHNIMLRKIYEFMQSIASCGKRCFDKKACNNFHTCTNSSCLWCYCSAVPFTVSRHKPAYTCKLRFFQLSRNTGLIGIVFSSIAIDQLSQITAQQGIIDLKP